MMSDDEDKIRLVVLVTKDGHPELFDELRKRSQSFRAERLRTLATFSLLGVQVGPVAAAGMPGGGQTATAPGTAAAPNAEPRVNPEEEAKRREQEALAERKRGFKDSLRDTFRV